MTLSGGFACSNATAASTAEQAADAIAKMTIEMKAGREMALVFSTLKTHTETRLALKKRYSAPFPPRVYALRNLRRSSSVMWTDVANVCASSLMKPGS
jgi:hypothetical protein